MTKDRINIRYRDSLFRIIFGEHKEYALALYNAVNHSSYDNYDDLTITTLEDAVYIGVRNDVSFLFNSVMNFFEHQSTISLNIPLRGLGYMSDVYEQYIAEGDLQNRIYGHRMIKIPTPRFYVMYNGTAPCPDRMELRLSEAYDGEGDLEVIAHVININKGHSEELVESCRPLMDYSEFVHRVRINREEKHMSIEDAVSEAIDSCIRDGIMSDFLRREKARVGNILYTALSEEQIEDLREYERRMDHEEAVAEGLAKGHAEGLEKGRAEGLEKGRAEGRAKGRAEARFEAVEKIAAAGLVDEAEACEVIGVSLEDYKKFKAEQ